MTETKGELEQKIEQFSLAFAQLPDSIIITDSNFNIVSVNKPFEEMYGYTLEDLAGKRPDLLNAEPMAEAIQRDIYDTVASGDIWRGSALNARKDGNTFQCEMTISALTDEEDKPFAYVGTQKDITEKMKAEQDRKQAEKKYTIIIQTAHDGFWISDNEGRLLDVNDSVCDMLGYSREELLSVSIPDIDASEKPEETAKHIRNIIENGSDRFETRHRTKDGRVIDVEVSVNYMNMTNQHFVFIRDITERKKTQEKLIESQKMDSIGNLAAGIAHDFNNLLAGSMGYADLLEMNETDPVKKRYIETIQKANKGMKELTQRLIGFNRRTNTTMRHVNLNQIIGDVCYLLEHGAKGIKIEKSLRDITTVEADYGQMQQVLMNLCVNSKDAMPNGGTMSIETYTADRRIYLRIEDTGQGMDEQTLKHVYEPYFTTKDTESAKGTGLGLAMVQWIVQRYNGEISIDSVVGKGTTVEISFPTGEGQQQVSKHETKKPMGQQRVNSAEAKRSAPRGVLRVAAYRLGQCTGYATRLFSLN